jgi:DNA-binding NarL/FixJ family response regulator
VDDHKMMRDGLRAVLERQPEMAVVGEASSGHEAIALVPKLAPDVVVMDVTMPGLNGIDATRKLIGEWPGLKIIGLSMNSDRRYVLAMFEAGAVGYLLKNAASDELIQAIQAIGRSQTYISPGIADLVVASLRQSEFPPSSETKELSGRERQVLQLLAEGKASKEIAVELGVALPTVETHRRQIMIKLNIHSIAELTKYAIRAGLTSVDT